LTKRVVLEGGGEKQVAGLDEEAKQFADEPRRVSYRLAVAV
jgi:hypothetical protein